MKYWVNVEFEIDAPSDEDACSTVEGMLEWAGADFPELMDAEFDLAPTIDVAKEPTE